LFQVPNRIEAIMRNSEHSRPRTRGQSPSIEIGIASPARKVLGKKPKWLKRLSRALHLGGAPAKPAAASRAGASARPAAAPVPAIPTLDASPLDRLYELAPRLRRAWTAETSVLPGSWSADRAAFGQSAATACVLQDLLGGDILESRLVMADGFAYSHFANIVDGLVIDLAQSETERAAEVIAAPGDHAGFPSMRAYVLAQPGAQQSYAALAARIGSPAAV
jgi:hypothetical protein